MLKCKSGLNWVSQCWAGAPGTSHLLQLVMYANFGTFEAKSPLIFFSCSLIFFSFKLLLSILILVSVNLISLLQVPYIIAYHGVNVMICYIFILPDVYLSGTTSLFHAVY